jgi:hypothetical protein
VLQDFAADHRARVPDLVARGVAAVRFALKQGVATAMNTVNTEAKPGA